MSVGGTAVDRLVGSGRYLGMTQLHQAVPLVERQHALIEEMRARAPRFGTGRVLAERTGTTVRTVERDVTRLQRASQTPHRVPLADLSTRSRPRPAARQRNADPGEFDCGVPGPDGRAAEED
jgi:hypothetical protein